LLVVVILDPPMENKSRKEKKGMAGLGNVGMKLEQQGGKNEGRKGKKRKQEEKMGSPHSLLRKTRQRTLTA